VLPFRIARIGGGELAGNGQILAIAFERLVEALEGHQQGPHPVEIHR
jgi:hypothetical protein